ESCLTEHTQPAHPCPASMPYTTLFRSDATTGERQRLSRHPGDRAMSDAIDNHWPPRGPCAFCGHRDARHRIFDAIKERRRAGERDRKSTRLNSSHVKIAYAAFCVKKKI